MPLTQEEKEEVKEIVEEVIEARSPMVKTLISQARKFEESPEGRLLVLETKVEDLRDEVHGLGEKVDRLGERIGDVRTELTKQIGDVKTTLSEEIGDLKGNLTAVKWFVGILVVIFGALVTAIIIKIF